MTRKIDECNKIPITENKKIIFEHQQRLKNLENEIKIVNEDIKMLREFRENRKKLQEKMDNI